MSYKGLLRHPTFDNEDLVALLQFTSHSGGLWRHEEDKDESPQRFSVEKLEDDKFKIFDGETSMIGKKNEDGDIEGEWSHDGIDGGTFVLTADQ
eukprot:gnl/TRDRNA2_/TRDRNA2_37931_c0_seq1.p2 gnl/TRDRNA2_/TRDRNA2_37931_c0~~gnl/TRDRNA2_/TRDRNA2_37931_c0_seq1.p2  ORF type:complete len:107 (+),score=33.49 gnl/TRDRNA2_/TRDRNA2_37931_c0_seq1:41-322(+)